MCAYIHDVCELWFEGVFCLFHTQVDWYQPENVPSDLYFARGMKTASVTCFAKLIMCSDDFR